ncbi:MAG: DUF3109 family protein [Saprospiraceae bacterium]|nr:DUF3109 family protein [Saprospiraceae bacterium]
MILIQDKLISDELVEEHFICNLSKCKGACCWEGDMGAPLDDGELDILNDIYPKVRPFLTEEGQNKIDTEGGYEYFKGMEQFGTQLLPDGKCAFLVIEPNGIAQCGIEKAWKAGEVDFQKPISCHLYPIRVTRSDGFEALNYDRWDICSNACKLGAEHKVPVYKFLKDALTRAYGADFYEELDATATYMASQND